MKTPIELLVWLKIPDVTALTARRALQRRMGYGEVLADLKRADWWRLEVEAADEPAALALGHELAEQTTCFVNPNKHLYRVASHAGAIEAPDGLTAVGVLTGFDGDASADLTAQALRGRLGYGDTVGQVERGTLWTFLLREPDLDRARALAEAMTVTSNREHGLLINPHSMWWRWAGC